MPLIRLEGFGLEEANIDSSHRLGEKSNKKRMHHNGNETTAWERVGIEKRLILVNAGGEIMLSHCHRRAQHHNWFKQAYKCRGQISRMRARFFHL